MQTSIFIPTGIRLPRSGDTIDIEDEQGLVHVWNVVRVIDCHTLRDGSTFFRFDGIRARPVVEEPDPAIIS